mmetsp:Transcript_34459/g.80035  ORF Transcript_34459/g.80035 Transcript_34459/m.80035 type:complete len:274 (+) Transcript_34459:139-960(+)
MHQRLQEELLPAYAEAHLRLTQLERMVMTGRLLVVLGVVVLGVVEAQLKTATLNDVEPATVLSSVHKNAASRHHLALGDVADLLDNLLAQLHQRAQVGVPAHGLGDKVALLTLQRTVRETVDAFAAGSSGWSQRSAFATKIPPQLKGLEVLCSHGQRHEVWPGNNALACSLRQQGVAKVVPLPENLRGVLIRHVHRGAAVRNQEEARRAVKVLKHDLAWLPVSGLQHTRQHGELRPGHAPEQRHALEELDAVAEILLRGRQGTVLPQVAARGG